jgi:xanthine/CO dehydrogenase XdhC/CoxF family maturation factor
LERISCPLGGNDPHEIAISIAAQLLERKQAQRPASRTRVQWGQSSPIHIISGNVEA